MTTPKKKIINKVINTKTIPWSTLKDWEFNDLKDKKRDVTNLRASIINDGFIAPFFVWAGHEYVIDGNKRNVALQMIEADGYEIPELPYVEIEAATLQEAKAIVLKVSSKYGDITKLSFENFTIDLDVQSLMGTINLPEVKIDFDRGEGETDPDAVPDVPEVAESKLGDIYCLGEHIVMCGDSTNAEHVELLMAGNKADMVFTDPPYNVNYSGTGENTSNTIMNDKMSDAEFDQFLDKVFRNYSNHIKGGAAMYVFHSASTQREFQNNIEKNGFEVRTQLIWNKRNATLSWAHYKFKHEPFFYCCKAGESLIFYGDRTKTTVWDIAIENTQEYVHPTQKPVALVEEALLNSSKKDDIVMDLFGGSGSTLIGCHKRGRIARIMELDPKYVDVIVKRWEMYTGEKAQKMT